MSKPITERANMRLFIKTAMAVLALFVGTEVAGASRTTEPSPETKARINANYGKIPLSFEANTGQTNKKVKFLSRGQGYGLYLTPSEAVMVLTSQGAGADVAPTPARESEKESNFPKGEGFAPVSNSSVLRMSLANANRHPKLVGEEMQASKSNYFAGKNPKKWRTDIANYGKVRYEEVYKGIDLVYYGNQRKLEYDFIVQPGADYKKIRMKFTGADKVSIDDNGNLVLHTKNGDVVQHKPVVYQTENPVNRQDAESAKESTETEGENKASPLGDRGGFAPTGRYVILADAEGTVCLECGDASPPLQSADSSAHSKTRTGAASGAPTGTLVGFEVENYDPAKTLVIDPLIYSTYVGSSLYEQANAIVVDSSGNAYITGWTNSTNFPTTAGAYQTAYSGGSQDAFVTKLNSTGTALLYSTYLGGGDSDQGNAIAVDSSGNAYITGWTSSTNFPTTSGAYQTASGGSQDAFVTKLNSTGTALVYSTYLGGSGADYGLAIALDSSGNIYISGQTVSTNFPTTTGAYQTAKNTGDSGSAFAAKLNSAGTALIYSTYLGGGNSAGLAVDSSGNAYVTGSTTSSTPISTTPGAYQATSGGGSDVFVTKLNSTGTGLVYSTYLGGNGNDSGNGIVVDSSGNAYVTGSTASSNFPTTASTYQTPYGGLSDAFITKLNSAGTALIYSTYLGGAGIDYGMNIAVDSSGNAYVTGYTFGNGYFPTTSGAYRNCNALAEAFVTELNSTGTVLVYSSCLGGSGYDVGLNIALDSPGNVYIAGQTQSTNFPTTSGAYQTASSGNGDVFVTKLSLSAATATTTTVASSLNPSTSGASVTFTASVSGSGGTPTGTVTFKDGSTTLGTGTLSGGQATYTTSSLSVGSHSITAVYGGDSTFASSTSSALTQTVTAVNTTTTTTTTVVSSQNPSTTGESVTFTATVTSGSTTPTGTVTFKDGTTTLGTGTLSGGQATYTTSSLSVGSHSITAVYGGDSTFASSTSSALTQTVATTISEDYTGTYYGHGVTIHLQQTGTTLTGRFYIGNSSNGGNIGGVVDSSGRAYAWAWWDNTELGSGAIAGRLTISGSQGTFSFGGGRNTSGRVDEVLLSDMTKSSLAGATTITTGTGTANYAGTYTMTGLTITLTQSGSILSGTFSSGGLTGNVGGFIDSSDRAYIWAYWESLFTGFGVVAGNLTVSGSQATFNFGGGRGSDGRIGEIILNSAVRLGQ